MQELVINLHMHTPYSDGHGSHAQIAEAALNASLDAIIVTDHNVLVQGMERYYRKNGRKTLLLVGEEIHNQARLPQKSHLLVFGAGRELATFADNPQHLIDRVRQSGGLSFLAHPKDPALPFFHEDDISWENWEVHGFTGMEIWNGLSELKNVVHNWPEAIFYAFFPQNLAHGPHPDVLKRWDAILASGQKIVAIGGSDAHALPIRVGPLRRVIFPYEFHFSAINTHLLVPESMTGEISEDRKLIYTALGQGHCFVGYDLPASTRGFRFSAQGKTGTAWMGDELECFGSVTMQIKLPQPAECHLLRDGQTIKTWQNQSICTWITDQPGIYRVECYLDFLGKKRGWIYSNPIYLKSTGSTKKGKGQEWSQTTLPVF